MKSYLLILEELNWPRVYFVSDRQFRAIEGDGLYLNRHNKRYPPDEYYWGISGDTYPIICIRHNLRGKVLRNTIYHEVLHILYPWRPHWWIETAAEVLAKGGGRGHFSGIYGHTPEELPDREKLLKQVRRQVARFNQKGT